MYKEPPVLPLPLVPSPEDLEILSPFINPLYFTANILTQLRPRFIETSQLLLANFLLPSVADELESLIREADAEAEKGRRGTTVAGSKANLIAPHSSGEGNGWEIIGPPHIQRFCALTPSISDAETRLTALLRQVHDVLRTPAFRTLLTALTSLLCLGFTSHVRRFRPGLDYTLARGEPSDGEAKLDVGLGLTPEPKVEKDEAMWEEGEVGGWELWLATDEGGDEATYGAGAGGKKDTDGGEGEQSEAQEEEQEDDGPLLAFRPGWNQLALVLRDPGVLKFVKYLSARAPGSRWDVGGEWEVAMVEDDGEEDGDEEKAE